MHTIMKTNQALKMLGVLLLCGAFGITMPRGYALDREAALTAARSGDWTASETTLSALANGSPTDIEACVLLVEHCLAEKRNKEAVAFAEKAAEAGPDNAGLQSLLGRALSQRINDLTFIRQGFVAPRMRRAFQRSVDLDPKHLPGLFGLANYYLYSPAIAGGDKEKADEYAARAEALAPFDGAVLRAQIRERQEKWAEAAEFFAKAAAIQPQNAWAQLQLGNALAKSGAADAARTAFESALKIQPDYAEAKQAIADLDAATNG